MRGNKALIARLLNESGVGTANVNARVALMDKAADALEKAERIELADSKVIDILQAHIIDLDRKLTQRAATIKTLQAYADDLSQYLTDAMRIISAEGDVLAQDIERDLKRMKGTQ